MKRFSSQARWSDFWRLLPLLFSSPLMFILACCWLVGIKSGADPDSYDGPLFDYYARTQKNENW